MPAHHRAKNNSANKVIRGKAITLQQTATHGPIAKGNGLESNDDICM